MQRSFETRRQQIERHYFARFGPASRTAVFSTADGPRIEILNWSEAVSGEDVSIYATIGASDWLKPSDRACEFFVGLKPAVDSIAEALAEVAVEGVGSRAVPNAGDTISLPEKLWPGTTAQAFLFTSGGEQIIPPMKYDGGHIEFIQLVPLLPDELSFKVKYGHDALWLEFERQDIPYWSSSRGSAR